MIFSDNRKIYGTNNKYVIDKIIMRTTEQITVPDF